MKRLIVCSLLLTACSTFHGPGAYQAPRASAAPSSSPTTTSAAEDQPSAPNYPGESLPNVTLKGERNTTAPESEMAFDWPVEEARLTQGFRLGRRPHWGIDLGAKRGTHVLAAERGYVVYTGHGFHGYGNLVVIEHGTQWATLYSHLDKILVHEGAAVKRGQVIGLVGRTGRASGYHLHFELRENRQPVNPLAYMPQGMKSEINPHPVDDE
jgi:murein DD-endopeptidase MepM/ murein hydrolase activator NlpD